MVLVSVWVATWQRERSQGRFAWLETATRATWTRDGLHAIERSRQAFGRKYLAPILPHHRVVRFTPVTCWRLTPLACWRLTRSASPALSKELRTNTNNTTTHERQLAAVTQNLKSEWTREHVFSLPAQTSPASARCSFGVRSSTAPRRPEQQQ